MFHKKPKGSKPAHTPAPAPKPTPAPAPVPAPSPPAKPEQAPAPPAPAPLPAPPPQPPPKPAQRLPLQADPAPKAPPGEGPNTCANCAFFAPSSPATTGRCQRYPPAFRLTQGGATLSYNYTFPTVASTDWCGEWEVQ
jgi:hypothetical protein